MKVAKQLQKKELAKQYDEMINPTAPVVSCPYNTLAMEKGTNN